jgi:hypothetical protein
MVLRARVRIVHPACIDVTFHNPSWFALNIFMCWMLSLMPLFANVLEALILSWASEFDHVCLMKPQPKLIFTVVILFSFTLFSSRCSCHFFIDFPLHPEQNIYKNISLLKSIWNYLSNKWPFVLNGARRKKLCPFYFSVACCPENFRTHALRCFGYNHL